MWTIAPLDAGADGHYFVEHLRRVATMQISAISPAVQSLIDEFHSCGGVVEYVLVSLDSNERADYETTRRAVLLSVEELERRNQITVNAESNSRRLPLIRGTRINGVEFCGPFWARNRQTLIVRGQEQPNDWFYANDSQIASNAVDHIFFVNQQSGYAYAFSQPPYKLHCPVSRQVELFRGITTELMPPVLPLADLSVQIYQWSTDWSPYFEAGREWWGEFLWTVWWPGKTIAVIAASTTD